MGLQPSNNPWSSGIAVRIRTVTVRGCTAHLGASLHCYRTPRGSSPVRTSGHAMNVRVPWLVALSASPL